jgi:transporter family protein
VKSLIVIALAVILKVFGNVSLGQGMSEVGEFELSRFLDPAALLAFGFQTLTNVWIIGAMVLLVVYIILYLSSLSWLDLSYVLPMTTLGYVLNALLAWLLLDETIAMTRWAGTFLIMIGVLVIGIGGHRRSRREALDRKRASQGNFTSQEEA